MELVRAEVQEQTAIAEADFKNESVEVYEDDTSSSRSLDDNDESSVGLEGSNHTQGSREEVDELELGAVDASFTIVSEPGSADEVGAVPVIPSLAEEQAEVEEQHRIATAKQEALALELGDIPFAEPAAPPSPKPSTPTHVVNKRGKVRELEYGEAVPAINVAKAQSRLFNMRKVHASQLLSLQLLLLFACVAQHCYTAECFLLRGLLLCSCMRYVTMNRIEYDSRTQLRASSAY
jgi:hypothetical protein